MSELTKRQYIYDANRRVRHRWVVANELAGLHFWCEQTGSEWFGGVEFHSATRHDYMNESPSHDNCWLLGGPCWHDGSSPDAREVWIPRWLRNKDDHDVMLSMLEQEFMERIECLS